MARFKIIGIFCVLLCCFQSMAQSTAVVDSLHRLLETVTDDRKRINLYLDLHFETSRTNQENSKSYCEQAIQLAQQTGHLDLLGKAHYRLSSTLHSLGDFDESLEAINKAVAYYKENGPIDWHIKTKVQQGFVYKSMLLYQKSLSANIDALQLAEQIKDTHSLGKGYNNLASLYLVMNRPQESIDSYRKAFEIMDAIDFKPATSAIANNLGLVFMEIEEYGLARSNFETALTLKEEINDDLGKSRVFQNLGTLFRKEAQFLKAIDQFNQSIQISEALKNNSIKITGIVGRAACYRELGRFVEAREDLEMILRTYDEHLDLNTRIEAESILKDTYLALGLDREATTHLNKLLALKDSLSIQKLKLAENELSAKFKSEQKAKELAELEAKSKAQELQIAKSNSERKVLWAIGISFLLLSVALFVLFRNKQVVNNKLREIDLIKTNFFTTISHELRTPLTLIMGPLNNLLKNTNNLDQQEKAQLQLANRNAVALSELVDQVFELSNLERGHLKFEPKSNESLGFLEPMIEGFKFLAIEKGLQFDFTTYKISQNIYIDQGILEKVFSNLFSNAIKYCSEKGEIKGSVGLRQQHLSFELYNSSMHLSEEECERIFQQYYQVNESKPGLGLGLYLVKQWVELHGGFISIESRPNAGVTLRCEIPVATEEAKALVSVRIPEKVVKSKLQSQSHLNALASNLESSDEILPVLLLVDDNEDILLFLKELFQKDYTLIFAKNGNEAESLAYQFIPDLIVCDVMMPDKSGLEVCEVLKSDLRTSHIPIILLTAKSKQEDILMGTQKGADDYLLKPFNGELLQAKVSNLIQLRRNLLQRQSTELSQASFEVVLPSEENHFTQRVKTVMDTHLTDPEFSVEQFAQEMGLSRMQLHRKLKALTGISTSGFIKQERLKMAASMLQQQPESIAEVCYQVGFNDHAHFSKIFKEHFGKTPTEYSKIAG